MSATSLSALGARRRARLAQLRAAHGRRGCAGASSLVDFWTYSCVNWLRTLPYVRAWHERYRDRGLVVVGVHAPEFGFEHDLDNVRRAVGELDVGYPVVIDNDFADLARRSRTTTGRPSTSSTATAASASTTSARRPTRRPSGRSSSCWASTGARPRRRRRPRRGRRLGHAGSPETYLGHAPRRAPQRPRADGLALNQWTLAGEWSVGEEAAVLDAAAGSIAYRFEARDLNLVLAPPASGAPVRFARAPRRPAARRRPRRSTSTSPARARSPSRGCTSSSASAAPSAERTFEITFDDPGVRAYVFTFG